MILKYRNGDDTMNYILITIIIILVSIVLLPVAAIILLSIICALLLSLAIYISSIKILIIEFMPIINPLSKT